MTGPRLDSAKRAMERLMVDECRIDHDPQESTDDVLEPDTLAMVKPFPDGKLLYEGKCGFRVRDSQGRLYDEGGETIRSMRGKVKLPLDAPPIPAGAVVTCTRSQHDPELVGKEFVVIETESTSLAIQRKLVVVHRTRSEDV